MHSRRHQDDADGLDYDGNDDAGLAPNLVDNGTHTERRDTPADKSASRVQRNSGRDQLQVLRVARHDVKARHESRVIALSLAYPVSIDPLLGHSTYGSEDTC
jgi:hypothetical protein